MFGNYTISSKSNTGSYKYESKTRHTAPTKSTSSYGNIAKQKKIKNEELQKKLEQEQQEYEATLQNLLLDQQRAYEDQYAMDPLTANLNKAFIATTKGYKHGHRYNQVKGSFDAASVNFNKNNNAVSFNSLQAKQVEPIPINGSKTISCSLLEFSIKTFIKPIGFSVSCRLFPFSSFVFLFGKDKISLVPQLFILIPFPFLKNITYSN